MSEGKKDDGHKAEETRLSEAEGTGFVESGSSGVVIMTIGPRQAEALRRKHDKEQAEREATGDETGEAEAGEETATTE